MKKICRLMSVVLVLTCILITSAFASSYDSTAQELKTMGLFKGTEAGFDLDRAPTRTEAAVMLVRLLGAEGTAQSQYAAGTIKHPFTDVPVWANPYVAWLYQNKLVNGASSTLFGADDKCNAQMFCTFVLRALGYSDAPGGDFTYANSLTYAEHIGIYSSDLESNTFLRDHAAAISYQALATELKGTTTTLFSKLVASGAVSQSTAKPLLDKITTYRAYLQACSNMQAINAIDMAMVSAIKMQIPALAQTVNIDSQFSIKVIVSGNTVQMEMITTSVSNGETSKLNMWVKDGYLYYNDGITKVKKALSADEISKLVSQSSSTAEAPVLTLYQFNSITADKTSDGTLYTIGLSDNYDFLSLLKDSMDTSSITALRVNSCSLQVLIGNNGVLSSLKESFVMNMTVTEGGSPVTVTCDVSINGKVNATGNTVTIAYPDFSGYVLQ